MQRDSAAVFTIALTITAAAFLALLYADGSLHRLQQQFFPSDSTPAAAPGPEAKGATSPTPITPPQSRSNRILECTKESGETFYTNAARCEDADLNNTVSVIAAPPRASQRDAGSTGKPGKAGSPGSTNSASARNTRQNVPRSMTVGCKWVIGRAQEVETLLNLKNPPKESLWKPNYCRWVCEARVKECGDPNDYLELAVECWPPPPSISARECPDFAARQVN